MGGQWCRSERVRVAVGGQRKACWSDLTCALRVSRSTIPLPTLADRWASPTAPRSHREEVSACDPPGLMPRDARLVCLPISVPPDGVPP